MDYYFFFYHCLKSVQIRSIFWFVFSSIRTEYGDLRSKSLYSVRIQENTDQKKLRIWTLFTQCILQRSVFHLEKKQKHLLRKTFGSSHTSNRIYVLRNCFPNYLYLKDMYITLKRIRKILFVSVLRILLICKFVNFTTVLTNKKFKLSRFTCIFPSEKVNFSLINPIHITIYSSSRILLSS